MPNNLTKNPFIRAFAGVVFALFLLGPSALFLKKTPIFLAWALFWFCLVAISLGVPFCIEIRGGLIISISVFCAAGGIAYAKNVAPADLWAVNLFAEIIGLVGSGIGGAYIATGLLKRERKV